MGRQFILVCVLVVAGVPSVIGTGAGPAAQAQSAAPTPTAEQQEFFETKVRPVLATACYSCHTAAKLAGLSLDSRDALLAGGKSGPAIVPGDPDKSLLIQAIRQTGELKMPKSGSLPPDQIADLERWVRDGAYWPAAASPPPASTASTASSPGGYVISPEQRAFWAFQPLKKTAPPAVTDQAWPLNDIDRFVLARLEKEGLSPAPMADRRTLLRRVTYDLTGLMPTQEEVNAFEADRSPDAYERVVDRLLASRHYGERWARHWLDVVRYSEDDYKTPGGGGDTIFVSRKKRTMFYPFAHVYRDWVIDALNEDMSYDMFVKAQLAADLLAVPDKEKYLPGLGLHGLGVWQWAANTPEIERADEWNDKIDVTTRAFLGLTVACARCHDHKYDPIPTDDYYSLASVFQSSQFKAYPLVASHVVEEFEKKTTAYEDKKDELDKAMDSLSELHAKSLFRRLEEYMVAAWRVGVQPGATPQGVAQQLRLDEETLGRFIRFLRKPPANYPDLQPWQAMVATGGSEAEAKQLAAAFRQRLEEIVAIKAEIDAASGAAGRGAGPNQKFDILPNGTRRRLPTPGERRDPPKGLAREVVYLIQDVFEDDLPEYPNSFAEEGDMPPGLLRFTGEELKKRLPADWAAHLTLLEGEVEALKQQIPPHYPFAYGIEEHPEPANVKVHLRGSPYALDEEAPRGYFSVLTGEGESREFTSPGSGRMELAERIIGEPLAQRVIVNRIWRWHMGTGIVNTPSNFGQVGERPTNPELLDYLAGFFVGNGMSWKKLHRLIVMSRAYQLSSNVTAGLNANVQKDPQNRLYWRGNSRRLEAEGIWDLMLQASGELDLSKASGPSRGLSSTMVNRGVFATVSRMTPDPFQVIWDFPNATLSNEARFNTTVPLQRLFFLNNEVVQHRAAALAARAATSGGSLSVQVAKVYELVFQRAPTPAELDVVLDEGGAFGPGDALARLRDVAWLVLGSNEFLFVD